ncbi:MAG: DUF3971 domain-containing protein [Alphaproteobacteria bacterium]
MKNRLFHFAWHFSAFSVKISLLVALVGVMAVAGFVWRVHSSPLDISFAKDYIQDAMRDNESGNYARMERAVLYWPDLTDALYLQLRGGQLLNKNHAVILSVDEVAISFSRYGLLIGKVMPKAIVLKQPTLQITRSAQGFSLDLGERPYGPVKEDDKIEFTTRLFGYLARPGYESAHESIISRLRAFEIANAKLRIDDHVTKRSWSLPEFNVGFYSTNEGMKGEVRARLPDVGLDESYLNADVNYIWDDKNVMLSADLQNVALQGFAGNIPELAALGQNDIIIDAHVETILDETFMPSDIRLSVTSAEGSLVHSDVWDNPVPYEAFSIHASYSYVAKALRLYDTAVTLGGIRVNVQGDITHEDFGKPDMLVRGPVKLWIDEARQSLIDPLWPKALRGDGSEEWIVQKMSKGVFKDITASLDLVAQKIPDDGGWDFDVQNVLAGFAAEGMDVDYRSPLDPATGVSGVGTFDLKTDELSIDITKGKIGKMPVSKAKLVFDKVVAVGEGGVDMNIDLGGDVVDILKFISKDPINLGDRIDMDLKQVKGSADLALWLNFPTQKDVKIKDFKIGVEGTLKKVVLPDVVETLDLGGEALAFSIKDGVVVMKGAASLDKRAMDFEWQTFLNSEGKAFKEKIKAKITADPNIRSQLGIDLSEFLEGSAGIDLVYTSYRDKTAKAQVKADLTPSVFFVEPFGYEKKSGAKGSANFTAHFKKGVLQKIMDLDGDAERFSLSKANIKFQQIKGKTELLSGSAKAFVVGDTKGGIGFSFDKNGTASINIKASVLDAQPFMAEDENKGVYNEPPMKITVSATNMLTAPEESVRDVRLYFDVDGQGRFNVMEMDGAVGKGLISARFKPDAQGRRNFSLKAGDAGAVLKAFQVYNNIRGGVMEINGAPADGDGDYNIRGKAEIKDFKVVKAPSLTKILSILSLTGIGEALTSDGLAFEKLEANYTWIYRAGGSLLKIKDGRTSGNSLGILFAGEFDNARRYIDVSGTVVPMSLVNEIIGSIPLIGDILTGGSGGVFAATYSVKGEADAPEIFVNPLSVLTPGIVRRVLFE